MCHVFDINDHSCAQLIINYFIREYTRIMLAGRAVGIVNPLI